MAITGDITKQSIVDRFEDLVTDTVNMTYDPLVRPA